MEAVKYTNVWYIERGSVNCMQTSELALYVYTFLLCMLTFNACTCEMYNVCYALVVYMALLGLYLL